MAKVDGMAMGMHRLLIGDGSTNTSDLEPLRAILELAGFAVESVPHPKISVELACSGEYAVVLFRVAGRGSDLEFVRAVRAHSQIPIMLVGKEVSDMDRILCLESGADEYLSQPFHSRELVARVRSIFRRTSGGVSMQPERITMGPLALDSATRAAYLWGNPLALTNVEFNVLEILLHQSGQVVSREYLAQSVLGRAFRHYDRSIDMHVSRIRKKLGDPADGKGVIRTIRNVGYMLTKMPIRSQQGPGVSADAVHELLTV